MNRILLYVLVFLVIAVLAWYFHTILAYILISGVLSLIVQPLNQLLLKAKMRKWDMPHALAAMLSLGALGLSAMGILSLFIPLVTQEAKLLSSLDLDRSIAGIKGPLESIQVFIDNLGIGDINIESGAKAALSGLVDVGEVGNSINYIFGVTGELFVALFAITFISFFFIKDERLLYNIIMAPVPVKHEPKVRNVMSASKSCLHDILSE